LKLFAQNLVTQLAPITSLLPIDALDVSAADRMIPILIEPIQEHRAPLTPNHLIFIDDVILEAYAATKPYHDATVVAPQTNLSF
jgi:hypothetical protein